MKTLRITRTGNIELAKAFLDSPSLLIGRSPVCDVVVRDASLKPVHFLLEWIGEGEFSSDSGEWALIDISTHLSGAEGIVLTQKGTQIKGLQFLISEEALTETYIQAHALKRSIENAPAADSKGVPELNQINNVLEVIQIRRDSQSVENVFHLNSTNELKPAKNLDQFAFLKFFQVNWLKKNGEKPIVKLDSRYSVKVWNKGDSIQPQGGALAVSLFDFYSLETDLYEFYIRIVRKINSKELRPKIWEDPLYKNLLILLLVFSFFYFFVFDYLTIVKDQTPPTPKRVARVEVKEVNMPPPPPPPPPPKIEEPPLVAPPKVPPPRTPVPPARAKKIPDSPIKDKSPPAAAAAPKFTSKTPVKPVPGLNSPAPKADVNKVGLAGLLNKSAPGGPVDPSKVIDTVQEDRANAQNAQLVLQQGQTGGVGTPFAKNQTTGAGGTDSLTGASTTLQASGPRDSGSVGAIAAQGGRSKQGYGSHLNGLSGTGSGNSSVGNLSEGFEVNGCLQRETVWRVIQKDRRRVERCYNQALMSNPRLEGKIRFRWIISCATGVVNTVSKTESDLRSAPALEKCLQDVIQGMQFPQVNKNEYTTVIYPFAFTPKQDR